jgi:DNA-binding NarL/FixJ family response regulator
LPRTQIATVLSGILGEIVGQIIRDQPDMRVACEAAEWRELVEALERTPADFIVVEVDGDRSHDDYASLVERHPGTRVLAVEADGRRGFLYELLPCRRQLGELSPSRLVDAIRQGAVPSPEVQPAGGAP